MSSGMNNNCSKDVVRREKISLWKFHEPVETGIRKSEELVVWFHNNNAMAQRGSLQASCPTSSFRRVGMTSGERHRPPETVG